MTASRAAASAPSLAPFSGTEETCPADGSVSVTLRHLTCFQDAETFVDALGADRLSLPYHEIFWLKAWSETVGEGENCDPVLLAGYVASAPAFFLPLAVTTNQGLRTLHFLGQCRANQATGVWKPDMIAHVSSAVLAREIDAIARALDCDLVRLSNLPDTVGGQRNPLGFGQHVSSPSPGFSGRLCTDFDAFFKKTHKKDSRKKLLKKQKALKAAGNYQIVVAQTPEDIETGLTTFLRQRAIRAAQSGIPHVFADELNQAFLRRLLTAGTGSGFAGLELWWLECDGKIRATFLWSRTADTLIGYASSIAHDDMTTHSPGLVLLKEAIQIACSDLAVAFLDLGLGDERYKRNWTSVIALTDCLRPLTFKGHLISTWYQGKLLFKARIRRSPNLWSLVRKLRKAKAAFGAS